MATLNQCSFIGRLGKDPEELKVTGDGKTVYPVFACCRSRQK